MLTTSTPPRLRLSTKEQALAARMTPLAGPYSKHERWMLDNVLRDWAGREYAIVPASGGGVDVWVVPNPPLSEAVLARLSLN